MQKKNKKIQCCFEIDKIKTIFFIDKNKVIHVWNDMRVNKWQTCSQVPKVQAKSQVFFLFLAIAKQLKYNKYTFIYISCSMQ